MAAIRPLLAFGTHLLRIECVLRRVDADCPDVAAEILLAASSTPRPYRARAVYALDRVDMSANACVAEAVDLLGMMPARVDAHGAQTEARAVLGGEFTF
jgi:hypothetical protein